MFTIIICTYNGSRTLERVLNRLFSQEDFDNYIKRIVVVDNASTDNTRDIVLKFGNRVLYSYEQNQGLSNARLNGTKLSDTEWTIFVDDDNETDLRWIKNIAAYIKIHPEVSAFCGPTIPKFDFEPTEHELNNLNEFHNSLAISNLSRDDIDFEHQTGPIFGAGLTIKTQILRDLASQGWLSLVGRKGASLSSGEDGEIFLFVEKNGYKIGYCTTAIIEHNIPRIRLSDDYLYKLSIKLAEANFAIMSKKRLYWLRRIKLLFRCIKPISKKGKSQLKWSIEKAIRANTVKAILKKGIFIR